MSRPTDSDARASDPDTARRVSFSRSGARRGFRRCLPVAAGVGGYGLAFGVLASRVGLTPGEATLMSATVMAGAAQLVAVELWADPVPVAAVVTATAAVNLRYLLLGAALRPWLGRLPPTRAYLSLFFTADENWALTVEELRSGRGHGAFLLGSGLAIWVFWVAATAVGAVGGARIGSPARFGLDFVLPAVLLALATDLWEGRSSVVPWAVAAVVAAAGVRYLPGHWYVVCGGTAGGLAEALRAG